MDETDRPLNSTKVFYSSSNKNQIKNKNQESKLKPTIEEVFKISKKYNVPMIIKYLNFKDGLYEISIYLGDRFFNGTGKSEIEAIENGASKVDLYQSVNFQDGELMNFDESIFNYNLKKLNNVYLQMKKKLDLNCLITFGDSLESTLFIHKLQLGKLISYGIGDEEKRSQNQAIILMFRLLKKIIDRDVNGIDKQIIALYSKRQSAVEIANIIKGDNINKRKLKDVQQDKSNSKFIKRENNTPD